MQAESQADASHWASVYAELVGLLNGHPADEFTPELARRLEARLDFWRQAVWRSNSRPSMKESLAAPPPLARLVADDRARFRDVNTAASELLRYPKRRLLQLSVWDITPKAQRAAAREAWSDFLAAGHQAGEHQVETSDGILISVHFEAIANFRAGLHLSLLRPIARGRSASRPLDECPFERPFPPGFDFCPHHTDTTTDRLFLHGRDAEPVHSCAHLKAAQLGERPGAFYGRCGLGDAIARSRLSRGEASDRGDFKRVRA